MSAFRRRTHFAAPFIISVAACSGGKSHESTKRFPGTVWYVMSQGPNKCTASFTDLDCPKGAMCNPPPPSETKCPPFTNDSNWANVARRKDGTCAVLPAGCLEESCLGAATPCPLEIGQQLPPQFTNVFSIIQRSDDKVCLANESFSCPPNVPCNPPPPMTVPCPADITPDKTIRVGALPDGSCVIAPEGCTGSDCAGAEIDCPEQQ